MKKLTAGIFATLMVIVTAGVARADIASTEYVNGELAKKENSVNRVTNTSDLAGMSDKVMEEKYPSVKVMKDTVEGAVSQMDTSVQEKLGNYQTKAIVANGEAVNALPEANRESHYTSVQAAQDIARQAVVDGMSGDDWTNKTSGFQTKDNIVADSKAADDITDQQKRKEVYTSLQAADEIAGKKIDEALGKVGFEKNSTTGQFSVPYELAENKTNVEIADSDATAQAAKFPTYRLTSELIQKKIDELKTENGTAYQPKNDLLTKLAALDTSACGENAECVLKYNSTSKNFELEVIYRGTTTPASEGM